MTYVDILKDQIATQEKTMDQAVYWLVLNSRNYLREIGITRKKARKLLA